MSSPAARHRPTWFRLTPALALFALLTALLAAPASLSAIEQPSSDLLLPYFEVDLADVDGRSTLFALGNADKRPVEVKVELTTDWGISVLETELVLAAGEVMSVNLRDWLTTGVLPDRTLGPQELAHVRAVLVGDPSPADAMYYGSADPELATLAHGAVTFRVTSSPRADALWGDVFWIEPGTDAAEGDILASIDPTLECQDLCDLHRLRFFDRDAFDGKTEILLWSPRRAVPSPTPVPTSAYDVLSAVAFHRNDGEQFAEMNVDFLPVQRMRVRDLLDLVVPNGEEGWMDIATQEPVFVGVRYHALDRFDLGFQSWCLPEEGQPRPPRRQRSALSLEKATNGVDADLPGGAVQVLPGALIEWTYVVTNTGETTLSGITLTDAPEGPVICPRSALGPGESMTCTLTGIAASGLYRNVGTARADGPGGVLVESSDPSHYQGSPISPSASVTIQKQTNGHDADEAPGPTLVVGSEVLWTYVVTNTGSVGLVDIVVTDDQGVVVACPGTALGVGQSMTCTGTGTAVLGPYANLGTVTASPPGAPGESVESSDPSHYTGAPDVEVASIVLQKSTNGHDADTGPGPELVAGAAVVWTYVVTNTGAVALDGVAVSDNQEGAVTCPATELAPGASMTCTLEGTAAVGAYANVGSVLASTPSDATVSDTDPSHYVGVEPPASVSVSIEKSTNGFDADSAPGPTLMVGATVTWSYLVTNTGEVELTSVAVVDDQEGAVSCPETTLAPAASMTCMVTGTVLEGQYRNEATVTAFSEDTGVFDTDPSHYLGEPLPPENPCISIEKATNGQDADTAPGPTLSAGEPIIWTYVVNNCGDVALANVTVTDDPEGPVVCPKTELAVAESMTCTLSGAAAVGAYANLGQAAGISPLGTTVTDTDPSHYTGEEIEECGACEGKVTRLELRYTGAVAGAQVRVVAKRGPENVEVFNASVSPGGVFELIGPAGGTPGFEGTLGTEIEIFVGGVENASIHTSCSVEVGPGFTAGDFVVVSGASQQGGPLCPID